MNSITFVSFEQHYYDRHQFYTLASYLISRGIKVSYVSSNNFKDALETIAKAPAELLGYSAYSTNFNAYVKFDEYQKKELGISSIVGGPAAIFHPETFLNTTIDAICVGEGEEALFQYMLTGGRSTKNILKKNAAAEYIDLMDLDSIPFPNREIVYEKEGYLKNMKYRFFLGGRGCPYSCSYCFNHIFNEKFKDHGKIVRRKSVEYFIEEIRQVDKKYNPNLIAFEDDIFALDRKWLFEFCDKYKREINKQFTCNIRTNTVDEEIIRTLKDSGCVCYVWGIESGSDFLRNDIMKRNITKDQILQTAELLNKNKLKHKTYNIIALPHETERTVDETIRLNIQCKPGLAIAYTLLPFTNLQITKYAAEKGFLSGGALKISNVSQSRSVLNFTEEQKDWFYKTIFLFPFFVNFPILYDIVFIRKALYGIPAGIVKYLHGFFEMYKMHALFPHRPSLKDMFLVVRKYIKYSIADEN